MVTNEACSLLNWQVDGHILLIFDNFYTHQVVASFQHGVWRMNTETRMCSVRPQNLHPKSVLFRFLEISSEVKIFSNHMTKIDRKIQTNILRIICLFFCISYLFLLAWILFVYFCISQLFTLFEGNTGCENANVMVAAFTWNFRSVTSDKQLITHENATQLYFDTCCY